MEAFLDDALAGVLITGAETLAGADARWQGAVTAALPSVRNDAFPKAAAYPKRPPVEAADEEP